MAKHLEQGKKGEQLARQYLLDQGYQIWFQNWRHKNLEVDLIAHDGETLVFVEVKTRSSLAYGEPSDFVDSQKQKKLLRAADHFITEQNYQGEVRFDIVAIYLAPKAQIRLIKDAFWSD